MGKEKKEIWMEKLIELLQEYLNSEVFKKDVSWNDNIEDIPDVKLTRYFGDKFYCTYIGAELEIPTDTVIGKRYGFIKWLVENDKIDQKGIEYKFQDVLFELEEEIVKEKSDFLIMLLSISDTPIEDLLLYLK